MAIIFSGNSMEIHLYNEKISYIIKILGNGQLGNLYFGKRVHHRDDYSYLLEGGCRPLAVYTKENDYFMSPQYTKMEYPDTGRGDFREPAYGILHKNGSRISAFSYKGHKIFQGKKKLKGLPAVYVESEEEAETLEVLMEDEVTKMQMVLSYTIFKDYPVLARSVRYINNGNEVQYLTRALSASIDFPDAEFEMLQLSGAWARERHIKCRKLQQGIQGIGSRRGISSAEHNPFIALKRESTDEFQGEVYAFSLIYSGNHIEQVEVDTNDMTRVLIGIHPDGFCWPLEPEEEFQTPEAVIVYTDKGLNGMSHVFHDLYASRLVRGEWRGKERPVVINNWEATGMHFTEHKLLEIAKTAKEAGVELFVLDDGWFGNREDDRTGLGDWYVTNFEKLPDGIEGLARKIEKLGMKFGLWFEPEMVNKNSNLYRMHPDWILCPPDRIPSPSRNQYVLDFSKEEVVDYIYGMMDALLGKAQVSYIKWDMNRYITECYSRDTSPAGQGKIYHQYILGVYSLYERLIQKYPNVLFESCSSGGARFDPGMLYYAPQAWTSDNTDAYERIKIQYGTSMVYPVSSMGAHVSEVPNQQVGRTTPLETRGNVAMFGAFGYELDLSTLLETEKKQIREQVDFFKQHRRLLQFGRFYRLINPFEEEEAAWMTVSEDRTEAIVGFFCCLKLPNAPWFRLHLHGLAEDKKYIINNDIHHIYYGSELMYAGLIIHNESLCGLKGDFSSAIYFIKETA